MDETSVTIGAAPERVWEMVSDITRMGEWSPGNTGGKWILGAKGPAVGAKFLGFNKRGFKRWFTTCKVTECEKPNSFAFQVIENRMKWGFRLQPTGDGGTVLTQWRDREKPPIAPVRALATVLFQGKIEEEMVEGMQQTLAAIKATAEQPAG
jgi:uncharacterized protein YndB with AHSA1/START domain